MITKAPSKLSLTVLSIKPVSITFLVYILEGWDISCIIKTLGEMARKKVKLQWIVDIVARKATYKKKVKGLMKNVRDLSILSGVDAWLRTTHTIKSPKFGIPSLRPSKSLQCLGAGWRMTKPRRSWTKKISPGRGYSKRGMKWWNNRWRTERRRSKT